VVNSPEIVGESVYMKALEDGAKVGVKTLTYNGRTYTQTSDVLYTTNDGAFEEVEEYTDILKTYDESSMRIEEPTGIRVKASVAKTVPIDENVEEYGFVIARKDALDEGKLSDLILSEENLAAKLVVYGAAYKKGGTHKVYAEEADLEFFTAVLTKIPETKEAMTTRLVFRPYIRLSDRTMLYGAKVERSLFDVAKKLYFKFGTDEATKAYAEHVFDICEFDYKSDIFVNMDELYD
jgi:hypothetical protein